jgi:hypothetical protein
VHNSNTPSSILGSGHKNHHWSHRAPLLLSSYDTCHLRFRGLLTPDDLILMSFINYIAMTLFPKRSHTEVLAISTSI